VRSQVQHPGRGAKDLLAENKVINRKSFEAAFEDPECMRDLRGRLVLVVRLAVVGPVDAQWRNEEIYLSGAGVLHYHRGRSPRRCSCTVRIQGTVMFLAGGNKREQAGNMEQGASW
jgi:hypothetical protein